MYNQMHLSNSELLKKYVSIEVESFKKEGYVLINEINWKHLLHRYMMHKSNGNRIDIFGYPEFGDIVINRNTKRKKKYNVLCK